MNAHFSKLLAALMLSASLGAAYAQPASAPASKAAPRPAATTPPNTVPYSPSQADAPEKTVKVSAAKRKEAKAAQVEARKTCNAEQDKKVKRTCLRKANEDYRRAVTS